MLCPCATVFAGGHRTMKLITVVALFGALMMQGSAGGGVHVWKSTEIRSKGDALAKKLDANKVATEPLGSDGKSNFMIAHREASGQAEIHDTETDILVFVEGQVTIVHGG